MACNNSRWKAANQSEDWRIKKNITIELKKFNQYIRQYQHTCYLKHAPPDGIIVGCSSIF